MSFLFFLFSRLEMIKVSLFKIWGIGLRSEVILISIGRFLGLIVIFKRFFCGVILYIMVFVVILFFLIKILFFFLYIVVFLGFLFEYLVDLFWRSEFWLGWIIDVVVGWGCFCVGCILVGFIKWLFDDWGLFFWFGCVEWFVFVEGYLIFFILVV